VDLLVAQPGTHSPEKFGRSWADAGWRATINEQSKSAIDRRIDRLDTNSVRMDTQEPR
jgi:hypothetical protein